MQVIWVYKNNHWTIADRNEMLGDFTAEFRSATVGICELNAASVYGGHVLANGRLYRMV